MLGSLASRTGAKLFVLFSLISVIRGDCGPPKALPNAELRQEPKQSYPVGTTLHYTCIPGYRPSGQLATECLSTSEWTEASGSCQRGRCPVPSIPNGQIAEETELLLGESITFVCDEGHRAIGRNGARCVLQNNKLVWSNEPPHCERIPCRPPPEIDNGNHNGMGNYVFGSIVTYRCTHGFSLIGKKSIVCKADQNLNGKWSDSAPQCKDGTLFPSSGPEVTSVFGSRAPPVTVATYTSALPTLQTELALEKKLFIILQEIKDIVNIKTKSLEERLNGLEKKVDRVINELKACWQQTKEKLEEEEDEQ